MTAATSTDSVWRRLYHSRLRDVVRGRLDARLDWKLAIALAGLPDGLADATRQVVGRTRLWRAEKADVANDLIAHFRDGLEVGRSPEELLTAFGNQPAAAQLIRRAKRRNRQLAWQIWHYGWMCALTLVGVYVLMGLWMSLAQPTLRIDYLAAINKAPLAVPENERAWPVYRDALLAMEFNEQDSKSPVQTILTSEAKPGDADWKEIEKFLSAHADSIAKLREAAKRPNLGFVSSTSHADFSEKDRELFGVKLKPKEIEAAKHQTLQDRWVVSALLPDVQQLRYATLVLADDARRAAVAGDGQIAYDNVVAMLGVSRHCEETPFLVCTLVAESSQAEARKVIHEVLSTHAAIWTDAQLRDLAHKLAASRIDWQRGFDGERICFYDTIQRMYTDNGNGDGRLAFKISPDQNLFQFLDAISAISSGGNSTPSIFLNPGVAMLTLPAANMVVASRKEMLDMFDKLIDHTQAIVESPWWKQTDKPSFDEEMATLSNGPIDKFRYLFVNLIIPANDKVRAKAVVSNGERDGVFLGLALELYHRKNNKWPASLEELSPQWLPQLPVDAITGKPLHYKVVNDRPLVYSVGADGDDDGGRRTTGDMLSTLPPITAKNSTPEDGDWVIWPGAKEEHAKTASHE